MKIAFIGQKGIPATFGGIEYHVDELARRLVEKGHDVTVYVRSWYTPKGQTEYQGVELVRTATIKTKHLDAFLHSLTSSIDAVFSEYDLVHYHALGPTFFCWLPKITGKKIVATLHGLDWERKKWGRSAKAFLKFTERTAIYLPARTIVVSKSQKSYFEDKFGRDVLYIPNGVSIPQKQQANIIKEKHGLEGQEYLLFMGRLVPEKRIDWLIEAFQNIDTECGSGVKLVLAGGTSDTDKYVERLRGLANHNRNIIFTGYVTGREKAELLSNARLFVLPSELEGLPIALLEAMSYGVPPLASNIPPHREIIIEGTNGFLFQWDDFSDLLARLKGLVRSSDTLGDIGKVAREKVRVEFNWDDIVGQTELVYRNILDNREQYG
jgi:glycosyltransferase involved in cell wall biosynthesis